MEAAQAKDHFERFLSIRGLTIADLGAEQATDTMVAFYVERPVSGVNLDEDGDMLLFQWGIYDWGQGESFEYNITRQLIIQDDEDEALVHLLTAGG